MHLFCPQRHAGQPQKELPLRERIQRLELSGTTIVWPSSSILSTTWLLGGWWNLKQKRKRDKEKEKGGHDKRQKRHTKGKTNRTGAGKSGESTGRTKTPYTNRTERVRLIMAFRFHPVNVVQRQ